MNITIRSQGFEVTAAMDGIIRNEIGSAMQRFRDSIFSVDVFMKDTNGPKGGVDKQVLLRIRLRSGQQMVLQTTREDLYSAVRVSIKRGKRALRRSLRKARRMEKQSLGRFFADTHFEKVSGV